MLRLASPLLTWLRRLRLELSREDWVVSGDSLDWLVKRPPARRVAEGGGE
jgi:hypothetical protein